MALKVLFLSRKIVKKGFSCSSYLRKTLECLHLGMFSCIHIWPHQHYKLGVYFASKLLSYRWNVNTPPLTVLRVFSVFVFMALLEYAIVNYSYYGRRRKLSRQRHSQLVEKSEESIDLSDSYGLGGGGSRIRTCRNSLGGERQRF